MNDTLQLALLANHKIVMTCVVYAETINRTLEDQPRFH